MLLWYEDPLCLGYVTYISHVNRSTFSSRKIFPCIFQSNLSWHRFHPLRNVPFRKFPFLYNLFQHCCCFAFGWGRQKLLEVKKKRLKTPFRVYPMNCFRKVFLQDSQLSPVDGLCDKWNSIVVRLHLREKYSIFLSYTSLHFIARWSSKFKSKLVEKVYKTTIIKDWEW